MTPSSFEAPLPLPGLQRARMVRDDAAAPAAVREAAARSLRRSAAAARALASGSPLVRRSLDEESGLGDSSWPHGRFPSAFAEPSATGFEKAVLRAARDDDALARLVAPLIAAGALQHPRPERGTLIAGWPSAQGDAVRLAFDWLRAREERLIACKALPEVAGRFARCEATALRAAAACSIASVFGRWWSEELFVLDPSCAWFSVDWLLDDGAASQVASWWMTTEPLWA